ncbi:MAG: rhodanese-like domain-containing protein [Cyanobacteriota bacterium]|nr:rhodanese-like domain-containing protein [Cyanobacteriota bacterium]
MNPAEVDALRLQGALVLDVRNPADFAGDHLDGALSVDFEHLQEQIQEQAPDPTTPIISLSQFLVHLKQRRCVKEGT